MDDHDIEVIMPTSIEKYSGNICNRKNGSFEATFKVKSTRKKVYKRFKLYDDAFNWIKEHNENENNINVKNIIYKIGDSYQCKLTSGKRMFFSLRDINIVNKYIWSASGGYAHTHDKEATSKNKAVRFHRKIMGKNPTKKETDHIDRNSFNNERSNLRFVSRSINLINKNISKNNKSGVTGVHYDKANKKWVTTWRNHKNKEKRKSFTVYIYGEDLAKEKAINYRKKIERKNKKYKKALGFV